MILCKYYLQTHPPCIPACSFIVNCGYSGVVIGWQSFPAWAQVLEASA